MAAAVVDMELDAVALAFYVVAAAEPQIPVCASTPLIAILAIEKETA